MRFVRTLAGMSALFLLMVLVLPRQAAASVNDFSIRSFDADYYLSRDAGKRSQLRVVETIVAEFPSFDQNHGLERAIPDQYQGHTVSLKIASVRKPGGQAWSYTTRKDNNHTVLRIGDADRYVHGTQTYRIEYTLRDVARNFDGHDELYWDVNGIQWEQQFAAVTARLHLKGDTEQAFTKQLRCFAGVAEATQRCFSSVEQTADETVVTFDAGRRLYAGETMTFVAGFEPGTFAPYEPTWWERYLPALIIAWLALSGVILLAVIGVLVHASRRYGRSPKAEETVVPEYLPPKDINVLLAANVLGKPTHAITAQLIDLAVRHYLKIYETETRGNWFRKNRTYELELVKGLQTLTHEERELVHIIFGKEVTTGQRVTVELLRSKLYSRSTALQKEIRRHAESTGLFTDRSHERRRFYWLGGMLLAAGIVLLLPGAIIAGIATLIVVSSWRPLTDKGVAQRTYLRGLHMYMKLAEADRLQQLQSPEGAAKLAGTDPTDKKQLVKLYERLLPYAILFGMEKEWAKALAPLYERSPDWYSGNWNAFHGAVFVSSLTSFTNASDSAFAPSSSSSSSGFSGGGSAGGGGGGGGGGGW